MSDYTEDDAYIGPDVEDTEPGGSWDPEIRRSEQRRPAGKKRRSNAPDMSNAPRPQDRKGKSAPQREAEADEDEMMEIEFEGMVFEVPADQEDWPIFATQRFSRGLHYDAVEIILGPAQWAKLVGKFPKTRDVRRFANHLAQVYGFGEAGN